MRICNTAIGIITLYAKNGKLCAALYGKEIIAGAAEPTLLDEAVLKLAEKELEEYFAGKRKTFTVPLAAKGTTFQQEVFAALLAIPYGETKTYTQIANTIKRPKAARAVGMGCKRNPLMVFIPCHRVVGASGTLTGYAGGLPVKAFLLSLEKNIT